MREGLYAIVGGAGVGACTDACRLCDAVPCAVVMPETEAEVCALMEYARGMRAPCVVAGSGTHLTHLTPHEKAWWLLSTRRLNRIIDYSPHDLVLTVGAGMTLQAVQDALREHHQYLPWNPALPQQATIGGIVASNRAGSWRYRFGTPRDRLLAIRAVRTDGVAFKSGAKVVKSVAGYDLHRLLCGSWGTLAVTTEITLKVQPLPQTFEAVGWFTNWGDLEPTLAELMHLPLQPDGISVLLGQEIFGSNRRQHSSPSRVDHIGSQFSPTIDWEITLPLIEDGSGEYDLFLRSAQNDSELFAEDSVSALSERRVLAKLAEPPTIPKVDKVPRTQQHPILAPVERLKTTTATQPRKPYILLEFSGRPEGVAWQIQRVREQGYPAEPVRETHLRQVYDWLAPRSHALMIQVLARPGEVAELMTRWAALQEVSMIAHAGSGILYIAVDESGLSVALIPQLRRLEAKFRVLNGAAWLRQRTGGELPRTRLNDGERRLMRAVKHALDERGILPEMP